MQVVQFHPDPARKLSTNLYDIHQCRVYIEKLLINGQRNCPKHVEFHSKNKLEKSVHLVGFILRKVVCVVAAAAVSLVLHYQCL